MDSRESMISGVTVIAPEAPSNYHVAPRTENSTKVPGTPPLAFSPANAGLSDTLGKKKRGRPRKYGPDATVASARALSPMPISTSVPPASGEFSDAKPHIQPASGSFSADKKGKEAKPKHRVKTDNLGEGAVYFTGGSFTPHVVTVNAGEDVVMKIVSFCQQGPRAICILSAVGAISNVTLRQADSSGGTMTYEGRFQILSLSGSFLPLEVEGTLSRSGGISICLSSPNGRVVGGLLAGLLTAATSVQVVVGSFLHSLEPKPKKLKPEPKPMTPTAGSSMSQHTPNVEHQIFNAHDQNNSAAGNPNSAPASNLPTDNWATMSTAQDARKSATDINISLQ